MAQAALERTKASNVLDVGCGDGNSADLFAEWAPEIRWVGVDIAHSPEVNARTRSDLEFHTFDGTELPFSDNSFDLVYSSQVLEHVRHPGALLKDIFRVLRPGGMLAGSTSHLEPFHSFSFWNFTPYGFKILVKEAGFELTEIRPSIDGMALIFRRLVNAPKFMNRWWWRESPLNFLISLRGRIRGEHRTINAAKLLYCGQFSFLCTKLSSLP